jgi:hypothetical protein
VNVTGGTHARAGGTNASNSTGNRRTLQGNRRALVSLIATPKGFLSRIFMRFGTSLVASASAAPAEIRLIERFDRSSNGFENRAEVTRELRRSEHSPSAGNISVFVKI